jgi:hypothetical protein
MHVKEESSCLCRAFCQSIHPFKMALTQGGADGGPAVANFERPLACHAGNLKCCCYQQLHVSDGATNANVGRIQETCYVCIPTYHVFDQQDRHTHIIHPPICFGCCVNPCAEGKGCCRVPFYVFDTDGYNGKDHQGKIVRVWGSLGTELIGIHQFEVVYPSGCSAEQKAALTGSALMLNELYFKPGSNGN